jgi:hypothetical protein
VPRTYLKLAAVVLASGIAVAACGSVKLGAAAIAGNQRISAAQLNAQVASLSAGYQQYKNKISVNYSQSQLPQVVLGWIVQFRVGAQAVARNGINVTAAASQKALNQTVATVSQGAPGATAGEVAVALGIPPDMLGDLGQWVAGQNALLTRLNGGKPTTIFSPVPAGVSSRYTLSNCRAAKSLDIQINPQYGALDYSNYSVVSVPSGLSKPQPGTSPSPSASKPVLTPPC